MIELDPYQNLAYPQPNIGIPIQKIGSHPTKPWSGVYQKLVTNNTN